LNSMARVASPCHATASALELRPDTASSLLTFSSRARALIAAGDGDDLATLVNRSPGPTSARGRALLMCVGGASSAAPVSMPCVRALVVDASHTVTDRHGFPLITLAIHPQVARNNVSLAAPQKSRGALGNPATSLEREACVEFFIERFYSSGLVDASAYLLSSGAVSPLLAASQVNTHFVHDS
jgi:hypothetical protein